MKPHIYGLLIIFSLMFWVNVHSTHKAEAQTIAGRRIVASVPLDVQAVRWQLVMIDVSTGVVTPLTDGTYGDVAPELSPDGERVVFVSDRADPGTSFDLFILELSTGLVTPLIISSSRESIPRWSPDGTQIAYEASGRDGNPLPNIYIINADGTNDRALTTMGASNHVWSPDGESIAFSDNSMHFYRIDRDGTNLQQITFGDHRSIYGRWSPDGSRFAIGRNDQIWFFRLDDPSTIQRVTGTLAGIFQWLDNDALIFVDDSLDRTPFYSLLEPQGTTFTTYRINLDGTNKVEVPALRPYMSLIDDISGFGSNRIVETLVTSTPTPTLNPTVTPTPASLALVRLTSMCSPDPASVRVWRVRNPNAVQALITWQVVGTQQTSSLIVPASSDAFFETVTVPGPNTTRIFLNGVQQDVKASGTTQCG